MSLKVHPGSANVYGDDLFSELQISIAKGAHEHVVVVVEDSHVFRVHETGVRPTLGLRRVPQPRDEVSQHIGPFGSIGGEMEFSIEFEKLLDVL